MSQGSRVRVTWFVCSMKLLGDLCVSSTSDMLRIVVCDFAAVGLETCIEGDISQLHTDSAQYTLHLRSYMW